MRYLLDHTAFFDANAWYLLPVLFMLGTLVFCIVRVQKMKSDLEAEKTELAAELADSVLREQESEQDVPEKMASDNTNL